MTFFAKHYKTGGLTIAVRSDLPMGKDTFHRKMTDFEMETSESNNIVIHHHFVENLDVIAVTPDQQIYFRPPWRIYDTGENLVYQWVRGIPPHDNYYTTAVTDITHSRLDIYHDPDVKVQFLAGGLESLTLFPSDQIMLARALAYKKGCILHSLGVILENKGYLFIGHSGAGKSTMAQILRDHGEILCDDRNILRKAGNEFQAYGTWSHGDVPDISASSAPLKGLFFLKQSRANNLIQIEDSFMVFKNLLACLVRPLVGVTWWKNSLDLLSDLSRKVPAWQIRFDKSGEIAHKIKALI